MKSFFNLYKNPFYQNHREPKAFKIEDFNKSLQCKAIVKIEDFKSKAEGMKSS